MGRKCMECAKVKMMSILYVRNFWIKYPNCFLLTEISKDKSCNTFSEIWQKSNNTVLTVMTPCNFYISSLKFVAPQTIKDWTTYLVLTTNKTPLIRNTDRCYRCFLVTFATSLFLSFQLRQDRMSKTGINELVGAKWGFYTL